MAVKLAITVLGRLLDIGGQAVFFPRGLSMPFYTLGVPSSYLSPPKLLFEEYLFYSNLTPHTRLSISATAFIRKSRHSRNHH